MTYGMLAGGSCLLTDIVDQLHELSKKVNVVEQLSRYVVEGTSKDALHSYLMLVKKWCPNQPVSIFSKIHFSSEKDFTSINHKTFSAMERGKTLLGKATFVMGRGAMTTRCSSL